MVAKMVAKGELIKLIKNKTYMFTKSISKAIYSNQKAQSPTKGAKMVKASPSPKVKVAANFAAKQGMSKSYGIGKSNAGKGMSNFVVMKGNSVTGKGSNYKSSKKA